MKRTIAQFLLMAAAAALLFLRGHTIGAAVVGTTLVVLGVLALAAPGVFQTLQEALGRAGAWFGTGLGLALLTVLYYSVFLLGALWLRIRRIDALNRSFPERGVSNWIDRVGYGADGALYSKQYTRPHAGNRSRGAPR